MNGWTAAALGVGAAFCAVGGAEVWYASARPRRDCALTQDALRGTTYAHFSEAVLRGAQWIAAQPRRTLRVVSYDGKQLYADFLSCPDARGTVLMFHGYRSCAAYDFAAYAPWLSAAGYNLLLCDQRAQGRSTGRCVTFGVRERYDVLSWVTYLAQMLGAAHPMALLGVSLGATTVQLASCFEFPANVCGIVSDCGFSAPGAILEDVLRQRCPHLPVRAASLPMRALAPLLAGFGLSECSTSEALRQARYPVLFIHGEDDTFVPCSMTQQAYAACRSEKRLVTVPGARHAQSALVAPERIQAVTLDFLQRCMNTEHWEETQ